MRENSKLILFQDKQIRRVWTDDKWFYSISDVVGVLTDSADAKAYWRKLKQREPQLVTICHGLKIEAADGKMRQEDCAHSEGLLRVVMSVPSPKAEPFKLWLASVGQDRLNEIENPELAAMRARELYRAKGYPDEWIEMRLKSIEVRHQLTDEWKNRKVQEGIEYSILTAEIARATFGVSPSEHKEIKGLARENLRDHMTNLELIFTMLGEESTRHSAILRRAEGFEQNKVAAIEGGEIAGKSREEYETRLGEKVVSPANFKKQVRTAKRTGGDLPEA